MNNLRLTDNTIQEEGRKKPNKHMQRTETDISKYWWDGISKTNEGCSRCKIKSNSLIKSFIAKYEVCQNLCGSIGGQLLTDLPLG